ncbi:MarR family winged helix-turn-helix transcriptional regulator [Rheinheimera baltica]|uniref:MarR family winged helix-turn-helix transcriptional regulator n=1 Tax=Rheinheimera baltica TaxID=67576 RepID=UPI00273FA93C|nr:MarR family winged helix-turn-helix transcriptional regulator [Rheinheimera baltica]MDP5190891.1 MarR family winged helix-turn-helix transcriptional regulator [Rheinheimera baltica]
MTNVIETTFHLAHAVKQQLSYVLETQNLGIAPMHVRVLKIIHKRKGCTAIDIAGLFKRDKAQITRLVQQLIELKLVQKQPNPDDKRSQLLVLTAKGEGVQHSVGAFFDTMQTQMFQHIEAYELEIFMKVAEKMTENLAGSLTMDVHI